MNSENVSSIKLNDLMFTALDHGYDSLSNSGGPLIPLVFYHSQGENKIERFVCNRIEEGITKAVKFVQENKEIIDIYAIVWDGFITIDNHRQEAIFVEAGEKDLKDSLILAQRYEWSGFLKKKCVKINNPIKLGEKESKLN